jgi:Flp pilus assembly pilin Flp
VAGLSYVEPTNGRNKRRGPTLIEYALIIGVVAAIVILIVIYFGIHAENEILTSISSQLQ